MNDEIQDFNGAEYSVPVRAEGKILLARIGLILLYITFAAAYCLLFMKVVRMVPMVSILPVFILILVLATWRFVSFEWGVRIGSAKLTVMKIRGRKETVVAVYDLHDVTAAAPIRMSQPEAISGVDRTIDYRPYRTIQAYDLTLKSGDKTVRIFIPACRQLVKAMRRYNSVIPFDDDYLHI